MGNFNTRRSFSGGQNEYRQMHKAVCSNCSKPCEVPFKPNGSKPVLCRDCFRSNNASFEGGRSEGRSFEKRSFENRTEPRVSTAPQINFEEQFKDLHRKLDKIMTMLALKDVQELAVEKNEEAIAEVLTVPVVVEEKKKVTKKTSTKKK